ncbi:MAG TPA: NADPH:quinone oxidoreductase family protein [Acidimicrobiales bacterium]|nr:NADPH:quinone oxidoreductase family protein [Acidimicrobiales bacterium]
MRAWRVHRYGSPTEALRLEDVPVPEPGPGQVLVRTVATVLNYNEIDGCRGRYLTVNPPLPYTLGMEVVGRVEAAGPGADGWLGRRVVATAAGAYGAHAEGVVADADMTFEAPESLADLDAAAFFFPFHLSHLGLFERGRLREGETVLVHAAAGGVGSAAVQLAGAAGARVIATCGGPEKATLCRELGADVVIDYRATDFVAGVDAATDGRGVDLVFDGVGLTEPSLRCLAYGGRYRIIGFSGGIEAEEEPVVTPRTLCFGNFSVGGVLLAYTSHPHAARRATGFNITPRAVGEEVHAHLTDLLTSGRIRPVVGATVGWEELPGALQAMEERRTVGRTVVRW